MTLRDFKVAIDTLRQGGIVVFPTETAYGIAADATNDQAVRRVEVVKGREPGKTPPLIVDSFAMAERYMEMSPKLRKLARLMWPGALTIVAPAKKKPMNGKVPAAPLSARVIRDDGTIAVRVSSHAVASGIAKTLRVPIVATSANVSGMPSCYSVHAVQTQFSFHHVKPDLYLDGGPLRKRRPSTIVTEQNGKIVVLRQGLLTIPKPYVA